MALCALAALPALQRGLRAQDGASGGPASDPNTLSALEPLEGTWTARGDGFTTTLVYEWALERSLLRARNEVRDAAGAVVGRYEGHYAWDAGRSSIVFWTVGQGGEVHRGTATWRDGRLWHEAAVSGGRIDGYRSVIEPAAGELRYRAVYDPAATEGDVLGSPPLVYHPEAAASADGWAARPAPAWFLGRLESLTRGGGRWEADNAAYRSDDEPFPSYGLEFTTGPSGHTARGRLFGILADGREQDLWEYYVYWDPLAGKAVATQTHVSGAFGVGELREVEPGLEELDQTFWWGDGSTTRSLHRDRVEGDQRHSQSLDYEEGRWVPRRQYTWSRVDGSQRP